MSRSSSPGFLLVIADGFLTTFSFLGALTEMADYCLEHDVRQILFDVRHTTWLAPSFDGALLGREAARLWCSAARVAILKRVDQPYPDQLFARAFSTGALRSVVVTSHEDARQWLQPGSGLSFSE